MKINNELKERINNDILSVFRKANLMYNCKDDFYTLYENNSILLEDSKESKALEVFMFTKKDINVSIDKAIALYDEIVQLSKAGITIVNAKNMREEARELKDEYDTYFNIYLNAPLVDNERVTSLAGCWNILVEKGVIDDSSKNRYEDYAKYYTRLYRLITLVEIQAPYPIITKEIALLAESIVRKDCFVEFGEEKKTNELDEKNEEPESEREEL